MIKFHCLFKRTQLLFSLIITCTAIFLTSCGGGAGAAASLAGVGSGGTGVIGTITGFASVIIDGIDYPYTSTPTVTETDINSNSLSSINGTLSLGQIVQANYDSNTSNLSSVTLLPELEGPVTLSPTSYPGNNGDYVVYVLGQPVRIVTNTSNTSSGVTTVLYEPQFQGQSLSTSSLISKLNVTSSSVTPEVVVYGMWVLDTNLNQYVLNATRLELTSTTTQSTNVELSGIATSSISAGQNIQFTLNQNSSYGLPVIGSVSSSINQFQVVRIIANRQSWCNYSTVGCPAGLSPQGTTNLTALNVANITLSPQANQSVRVSGLVSYYDTNQHIAYVQGVPIKLASSKTVTEGDYISSSGNLSNGELDESAGSSNISFNANNGISITSITNGINFTASATSSGLAFVLQGVSIFAPTSSIDSSCNNLTASNTEKITVTGSQTPGNPVIASKVICSLVDNTTNTIGIIVDYSGQVTSVSGSSFILVTDQRNISVSYGANTYIGSNVSITSGQVNANQYIELLGVLQSDGSVLATSIKNSDSSGIRSSTND